MAAPAIDTVYVRGSKSASSNISLRFNENGLFTVTVSEYVPVTDTLRFGIVFEGKVENDASETLDNVPAAFSTTTYAL